MSGVSKATTSMPDFQGHDVTSKLRLNPKAAQGSPPEVAPPRPETTGARSSAWGKFILSVH